MSQNPPLSEDREVLRLLFCKGNGSARDRSIIASRLEEYDLSADESYRCSSDTTLHWLARLASDCHDRMIRYEHKKIAVPREPVLAQYTRDCQRTIDGWQTSETMGPWTLQDIKNIAEGISDGKTASS